MARKLVTMDGNNAAAHVSYAFTEVAAIYPMTWSISGPPPAVRTSSARRSVCRKCRQSPAQPALSTVR